MTAIRILHVDDEPDIREIVEISLGLDPAFVVRSCGSGQEGLAVAAEWLPDVILLDVMMPAMDGPTTLLRLREDPKTAGIRVIFMTARAQTRELDRFRSLGAVGVIAKPFDPTALAASVLNYVQPDSDPLEDLRAGFLQRVRKDVTELVALRSAHNTGTYPAAALAAIRHIARGLAGAGGIYGFDELSSAATVLEEMAIAEIAGPCHSESFGHALDDLISCAENSGASGKPENRTGPGPLNAVNVNAGGAAHGASAPRDYYGDAV